MLLDEDLDVDDIAHEFLASPEQVAHWSNLPRLREFLRALRDVYSLRADIFLLKNRVAALAALGAIVRSNDTQGPQAELTRRAATTILRLKLDTSPPPHHDPDRPSAAPRRPPDPPPQAEVPPYPAAEGAAPSSSPASSPPGPNGGNSVARVRREAPRPDPRRLNRPHPAGVQASTPATSGASPAAPAGGRRLVGSGSLFLPLRARGDRAGARAPPPGEVPGWPFPFHSRRFAGVPPRRDASWVSPPMAPPQVPSRAAAVPLARAEGHRPTCGPPFVCRAA